MTPEYVKAYIDNALDLLQIIIEDVENNFMRGNTGNAVKDRATMTVSVLYILSDYLRIVREGVTEHG